MIMDIAVLLAIVASLSTSSMVYAQTQSGFLVSNRLLGEAEALLEGQTPLLCDSNAGRNWAVIEVAIFLCSEQSSQGGISSIHSVTLNGLLKK